MKRKGTLQSFLFVLSNHFTPRSHCSYWITKMRMRKLKNIAHSFIIPNTTSGIFLTCLSVCHNVLPSNWVAIKAWMGFIFTEVSKGGSFFGRKQWKTLVHCFYFYFFLQISFKLQWVLSSNSSLKGIYFTESVKQRVPMFEL